ncbi:pleckstrin-like proteiny domain-containing family M member 1 [Sesbania bispinosa]|nr:pleckstrin-like proteiny domain-containing family M member 1 [Sesbania bispinosa]
MPAARTTNAVTLYGGRHDFAPGGSGEARMRGEGRGTTGLWKGNNDGAMRR